MAELNMLQRAFLLACEAEGFLCALKAQAPDSIRLVEGLAVRSMTAETKIRLEAALAHSNGVDQAICYTDALALVLHVELTAAAAIEADPRQHDGSRLREAVKKWIEVRALPLGGGDLL